MTFLAVPSISAVDGVELQAQLVGHPWAPVRMAISCEHGLTAIAEARSLDGAGLEGAADVVQNQGRQSLAVNVLSDDQQRLAGLHDQLGDVHDILLSSRLPEVRRMYGSFEHGGLLGVGHEVRSDIALVEPHALGEVDGDVEAVGVLDGHDAVLADLSRASAIFSPTSGSAAEMVAVAAI